jgi:MFS family permease
MNLIRSMPVAYWGIWVPSFLFFAAHYSLLIPLPMYLTESQLASWQVGVVLGAFGVAALLSRPFAGPLADSLGRRPLMVCGAALLAAGVFGLVLTRNPALLFCLRMVQVIGYVAFTTAATARVVDVVPAERQGSALALFGISINLAMTIVPALVSVLMERLTTRGVFWLAGALAMIACALSAAIEEKVGARDGRWAGLGALCVPPALRAPMLAAALFGVGFTGFLQFLPLLAEQRQLRPAGLGYTAYGIAIVLTRIGTGRWQDGSQRMKILHIGFVTLAGGLCLLAVGSSLAAVAIAALVVAFAAGILHPGLIATHVERVSHEERGRAVGNFYLAFDMGIGFGPWLLTPSLQFLGLEGLYFTAAAFALLGIAPMRRTSQDAAASAGARAALQPERLGTWPERD